MRMLRIIAILATLIGMIAGSSSAEDKAPKKTKVENLEERIEKIKTSIPSLAGKDLVDALSAVNALSAQVVAEKLKEARKHEDSSVRDARRAREKKEKQEAERQKKLADFYRKLNIRGCPTGSVVVPGNGIYFSGLFYTATVDISNKTAGPVTISTQAGGIGLLAGNLCTNGSITLSFALPVNWINMPVMLVATNASGSVGSITITIVRGPTNPALWEIKK